MFRFNDDYLYFVEIFIAFIHTYNTYGEIDHMHTL